VCVISAGVRFGGISPGRCMMGNVVQGSAWLIVTVWKSKKDTFLHIFNITLVKKV